MPEKLFKLRNPLRFGGLDCPFYDDLLDIVVENLLRITSKKIKCVQMAFGCYMLNGVPVIDFKEHSKKEDGGEFLITIRQKNPSKMIVILCDNFKSHTANYTKQIARDCNIILVFLPKYSPDLNPIESIWKSIKRVISRSFVRDIDHIRALIRDSFLENASKLSFARYWIERFLGGDDWYKKFGY
ncbi:MAG: transposase [Methanothrix sp.]